MPHVQSGDTRVFWEEEGEGEPVLLVMGHAFDSRMWHRVVAALAPRYRAIVFDNRGVGRTEWPGTPFGIPDLAADGLAVLDAAGVDRAHVYGVSMGGLTAQELALSAPGRVQTLILGCTGTLPDGPQPPARRRQAWVRRIPRWATRPLQRRRLYGPGVDRRVVAEDMRIIARTRIVGDGLLAQGQAVAAYRNRSRLDQIAVPTLVLHGDADRTVPHAMGQELSRLIPHARFHTLPGAGHNYLDAIDCLGNALVLDFLAAHPILDDPDRAPDR